MTPVFVVTFGDIVGLVMLCIFLAIAIPVLIVNWWKDRKKRKKLGGAE
jgi:predicted membrane channel-forming protein YqfA (hemolysin III family)